MSRYRVPGRRVHFLVALIAWALIWSGGVSAAPGEIPLEPAAWRGDGAAIVFEEYAGRRALRVNNGEITMRGVKLRDGVIEFDLAVENTRGFAGVIFRRPDSRDGESFYFRSHQSGNPDANQYTPIFNGQSAWQIYYGPQYAAPTEYRFGEWMRVKLIITGDQAEVHLDGEPILHIDQLLRDPLEGAVSLWTNIAPAWFSNIRVSDESVPFESEPAPAPTMAPGAITQWQVSEEIPWSKVARLDRLDPTWLDSLAWQPLAVERNGIANLSRVADRAKGPAALARVTVPAEHASDFRFGFSDEVRAYVDGKLVYAGDDSYGSRDYRHLGTVGLYDTIHTEPAGAPVTFTFAVREQFGGWAVAGATPLAVPLVSNVETRAGALADELHNALGAFQRGGFSGAVVAAVEGKPILEAGYGLANRSTGTTFTVDTVAQIGSITKGFTAAAVIDLARRGQLDFDAPVHRYLPAAAAPAREVTIHQLLTHTSGMPEYCGGDFEPASLEQLLKECLAQPLLFAPGEQVAYSNPGYSVLAAVVEAASGQSLDDYLQQHLLEPNGLAGIGYEPSAGATLARGYLDGLDQGVISERIAVLQGDYWNLKGNGGMQASARDMFGWYEALAGRRELPSALAEMALEPRVSTGEGASFSYGWGIGENTEGQVTRVSFAGSDGTFFSYFWWNPLSDRFFYLVGNAGEQETIEVVRAVRDMLRD